MAMGRLEAVGRYLSDFFGAAVVKELRQELKIRSFVNLFIWSQVIMFLILATVLMSDAGTEILYLLLMPISLPLMMLVPNRAASTLARENQANTLELIFLTRLSSFRLVFSKWLALMFEAVLFVMAFLPYIIVPYFVGGYELVESLKAVFSMLLGTAVLAAFGLWISATRHGRSRGFSMGFFVILLLFVLPFSFTLLTPSILPRGYTVGSVLFISLGLLFTIGTWLELAAARIAPVGENHALRKRVLLMAMLVATAVLLVVFNLKGIDILMSPLFVPLLISSICETPVFLGSFSRPFRRFGGTGLFLFLFFQPGWPFGAVVVALALAAWSFMANFANSLAVGFFPIWLSSVGVILCPLAAIRLFSKQDDITFVQYLILQAVQAILSTTFMSASYSADLIHDLEYFLPLAVFIRTFGGTGSSHSFDSATFGLLTVPTIILSLTLLVIQSRRYFILAVESYSQADNPENSDGSR